MGNKQVSKKTTRLIVNTINFILFTASAAIGIIVQGNYHMHGGKPPEFLVWGMDQPTWNTIHIIVSVLALAGLVTHFVLNWKSVKLLFSPSGKKLSSKFRMSRIITFAFVLLCLTGLTAYGFRLAGDMITRHGIMEIHDKLGIVISILFIIHFAQHFRQLIHSVRNRQQYIPGNKTNEHVTISQG